MTLTTDELGDMIQTLINRLDTFHYTEGTPSDPLSGSGYHFPGGVRPAGYNIALSTVPDYYGFIGDKLTDGYVIDAGWLLPYLRSSAGLPRVELGALSQFVTGPGLQLDGFYYFLPPGIEIVATPLYPASI